MIYELLGMANSEDAELAARPEDKLLSEMTSVASGYLENGDFAEAARRYQALLERFPEDAAAKSLLGTLPLGMTAGA
jgi:hypothetical protein